MDEISKIVRTIDDGLSPVGLNHWNCMDSISVGEIIVHAQRHGVDSAIEEIEDFAS